MKLTIEETLTLLLTLALGSYFVMYYSYWMDCWYLLTIDPFIVLNVWIEYGVFPGRGG
jgi:hypothetical protein